MAKHLCSNGTYYQHSIDPFTKARLVFAVSCTKHLTGIESSNSGIVRAAIEMYVRHLDELLELPKDHLEVNTLGQRLRKALNGYWGTLKVLSEADLRATPHPAFSTLEAHQHKLDREKLQVGHRRPFRGRRR